MWIESHYPLSVVLLERCRLDEMVFGYISARLSLRQMARDHFLACSTISLCQCDDVCCLFVVKISSLAGRDATTYYCLDRCATLW